MRHRTTILVPRSISEAALVAAIALAISVGRTHGDDWPYWRGPLAQGVSRETGLIDTWDPRGGPGSNIAWQRDDLGGRSTPIVMNGRLYTILRAEPGTDREGERVVCLDAATGESLWENRFNVWLSDVPDTRIGWSACVGDPESDTVFALGVCGYFQCIDGATGKTIWSTPMHEEFGLLSTYGGRTNYPLVFEDLVIVSGVTIGWGEMAKPTHRFIAFDKRTGDVVWIQETTPLPEDTTYSAPALTVFNGQAAFVVGAGDGLIWAFQPRTGKVIWNFALSRRGVNASPLVVDETVYAGHSEENPVGTTMGAVVAIDGRQTGNVTESAELWRVDELMVGRTAPLAVDDQLFLFDDRAKLHVVNRLTGEIIGRRIPLGSAMHASPLYADGKIYVVTSSENWAILRPDPQRGARIVAKGRLLTGDEAQASPICANGRIYILTSGRLYCLMDPEKTPGSLEPVALPEEDPVTEDPTPAQLQIIPAELRVRPGESRTFTARLFNSKGQFLRDVTPALEVEGHGSVDSTGKFTAADDAEWGEASVIASYEGLQSRARIRIIPPLPWHFDFEEIPLTGPGSIGEPPVPWVGCRHRHVVRKVDGNNVMVKITTIPKGTRSRGLLGHVDLANYTIQADVLGVNNDGQLPDIGIIAQGYSLVMMGINQELQIRTWDAQSRMARTIPFQWDPDVWYRMKLRAEVQDGVGIVRGKVWPRDGEEPREWTLEARDPVPNLAGSPGLFGNATLAEILIDNIDVFSNSTETSVTGP